jgi:hypothetical protein
MSLEDMLLSEISHTQRDRYPCSHLRVAAKPADLIGVEVKQRSPEVEKGRRKKEWITGTKMHLEQVLVFYSTVG